MKKIISILLVSYIASQSYAADCPQPVAPIKSGEVSKCDGFIFSRQQEQKMYLLDENSKLLQQQLDNTTAIVNSYKKSLSDFQVIVKEETDKSELWRKAAEDST